MCGRYTIISKLQTIEKRFQVDVSDLSQIFEQNVNVSPGEKAIVITNQDPKKAQLFTFGLTPSWAQKRMYVFNARSEGDQNQDNDPNYRGAKGIIMKPMFRKPIRTQRCLVIADAFIEGPEKEKLSKPFLVYSKNKKHPFAMAGIWDEWVDISTGEVTRSFAIITTTANALLEKIGHHRSPVILEPEVEHLWLSDETPLQDITGLLHPFNPSDYNAYPISPEIKSSRNKDIDLLKPIGQRIAKEYDYMLYQELELQGMGETTARKRKNDQQMNLFE